MNEQDETDVEEIVNALKTLKFDGPMMQKTKQANFVPETIGYLLHWIVCHNASYSTFSLINSLCTLYRLYYEEKALDDSLLLEMAEKVFKQEKKSEISRLNALAMSRIHVLSPLFEKKNRLYENPMAKQCRKYLEEYLSDSGFDAAQPLNVSIDKFILELLFLFDLLVSLRETPQEPLQEVDLVETAAFFLILWNARGNHVLVRSALWQVLKSVAMARDIESSPRTNRWLNVVQTFEDAAALETYGSQMFALCALFLLVVGNDSHTFAALSNVLDYQYPITTIFFPTSDAIVSDFESDSAEAVFSNEESMENLLASVRKLSVPLKPLSKAFRKRKIAEENENKEEEEVDNEEDDDAEVEEGEKKVVERLAIADAQCKFYHLPLQSSNSLSAAKILSHASILGSISRTYPQTFVATLRQTYKVFEIGNNIMCFGPFVDSRQVSIVILLRLIREAINLPTFLPWTQVSDAVPTFTIELP